MPTFLLPDLPEFRASSSESLEVSGEDVMFKTGMEISAGDWRTVRDADAAEQSVRREMCSTVGGLMRRPDWGVGATENVFQSITKTNSDALVARTRKRMLANPRVGRFVSADVVRVTGQRTLSLQINYEPVGNRKPTTIVLKGDR